MTKHALVGLKEFRENLDKYAKAVGRGSSYTILRRSKPLFRIAPVDTGDDAGFEVLFDATRDNGGKGIRADALLLALKRLRARHG
ncbi:MAG: hypothetical protein Q7S26_00040 [bacterium]|nr:hypothetical protein [bacterium]